MTVITLVTNSISLLQSHDFTWRSVSRDTKVLSGTLSNFRSLLWLHSLFSGMSAQPCECDKSNTEKMLNTAPAPTRPGLLGTGLPALFVFVWFCSSFKTGS